MSRLPHYPPASIRRRLHQAILALFVAATVGCISMVIGPALNDREISKAPGRTLAKVIDVGTFRSTVEYQDEEGVYHSPRGGLLYPTGLGKGQRVWVTYAKSNPDLVKVQGRGWTLALIPALSTWVVSFMITMALWWAVTLWYRKHANSDNH
ncbi:hypothetical protein A4R63_01550 [Corynebacterium pseudotuberculosis]|uniref:DUF3592 domain-containing protein n=1 Tax=Corynebacterium pseudotuberculosis TaxID=1719 RepID=UPI00065E7E4E|nr:DUF3592 domain-containing protein [Corynebacterium pseudotuberculosis]AKN59615.2 hypothetical protein CP31_01805 [Corynebacterium pseudotuberculosis 31]APB10272.1 hypothetical protein A4R72_01755 [Corynebacterium pseudotuberculosis]APB12321.1 hypothetical protein A4R71_01770 [Corynebacterium pseudotuberculosis]APB14367.1 hypothetical protein A4R68_01765 [Corynebacterium pseudotuberculosis]APB16413.1 hypothetical protein A4R67_01760 [Corynebacterium pseudotuberculosis]